MKVSIIISCYNEEQNIPLIYSRLLKNIHVQNEILFIDDGSIDDSRGVIEEIIKSNRNVIGIFFSRNFGHESAMQAGLNKASGDILIFMDADLQHPPELIPDIIAKYMEGFDIVKPQRVTNRKVAIYKKIGSGVFYFFINLISNNRIEIGVSDFFLISSKVADVLRENYSERVRFFRGMVQSVGFRQTIIKYDASERIHGNSNYSFLKLLTMSFAAMAVSSKAPLKLGISLSIIVAFLGISETFYAVIMKLYAQPVSGYTTIVILISFLFSFLFLFLGIIAEYIGIIFDETKKRPNYVIDKVIINETRIYE